MAVRRPAYALAALLLLTACGESGKDGGPGGTRGGASVAFEVEGSDGDVEAAAKVLQARVGALGLEPGEAKVEGKRVSFSVSRAVTEEETNGLARTGYLTFRPVVRREEANATIAKPRGDVDCTDRDGRQRVADASRGPEHDDAEVVACHANGTAKYLLAPVGERGTSVVKAEARESAGGGTTPGGWVVGLEMRDAAAWESLTKSLVGRELAIVLDGIVQTAPSILEQIPDGVAEISGSFTEQEARLLAAVLRSGSLPPRVVVKGG